MRFQKFSLSLNDYAFLRLFVLIGVVLFLMRLVVRILVSKVLGLKRFCLGVNIRVPYGFWNGFLK